MLEKMWLINAARLVGAAISALSGAKYLFEVLEGFNSLRRDPVSARDNDFYFIWRAKGEAK